MSIVLKNKTGVETKISIPGLFSGIVPAFGELIIEDVVKKKKIPTDEGEVEIPDITSALTIAKGAVNDYGKPGLEFEFRGKRYSYQREEDITFEELTETAAPSPVALNFSEKEEVSVGFGFETETEGTETEEES